jgi:hypothetical protein
MVYVVAAAGMIFLSIVYWRDPRLRIFHRTLPPYGHQEFLRDVRKAMEANDNI